MNVAPSPPAASAGLPAAALDAGLGLLRLIRSEIRDRRPGGLTMAQFRVLHLAHRDPDRSLADVAEDLGVSAPAVTKLVDILTERGLVARTAVKDDRRSFHLALTPAGLALLREARRALEARVAKRLDALPAAEAAALARGLAVLRSRLDPMEAAP